MRKNLPDGFLVQKKMCSTCIYRPDSPLDIKHLESQVADRFCGFDGFRACHHTSGRKICCRGFWYRHKDKFALGQIAQRLNMVRLVVVDTFKKKEKKTV